jgi:hypothetical protein
MPGTDKQRPDDHFDTPSSKPMIPTFSTDTDRLRDLTLSIPFFLNNRFPSANVMAKLIMPLLFHQR